VVPYLYLAKGIGEGVDESQQLVAGVFRSYGASAFFYEKERRFPIHLSLYA